MSENYAGVVVVGETITVVHAQISDDDNAPVTLISDETWTLQKGDRGPALNVLYTRCQNFCDKNNIDLMIIKASAVPLSGVKLAVLHSAEVRGVVIAAAASKTDVQILAKAKISKSFGERKVDDYLKDDPFWKETTCGAKLRKTSREAAMLVLASRGR